MNSFPSRAPTPEVIADGLTDLRGGLHWLEDLAMLIHAVNGRSAGEDGIPTKPMHQHQRHASALLAPLDLESGTRRKGSLRTACRVYGMACIGSVV